MRAGLACALLVALPYVPAVLAQVILYDSGGFEDFSVGSLVALPQGGWTGYALNDGLAPEIVEVDGDRRLQLAVPAGDPPFNHRKESRVVLRLSPGIPLGGLTELTVDVDLHTDVDGNGVRHNVYFDIDTVPDKFLPDAQIVQDIGYVQMLRGGNQTNGQGAAGNGLFSLRWTFDLVAGLADASFGARLIDDDSPVRLDDLIANQPGQDPDGDRWTLDAVSFALVSDLWTGPADVIYLDNVVIWGYPAMPGGLEVVPSEATIRVGGQVFLRAQAQVEGGLVDVSSLATWSSADPSVATVTGGLVTGIGEGFTRVWASYAGFSASSSITVHGKLPPEQGTLWPRTLLLNYDPVIETAGNQRLHECAGWHDPVVLEHRVIADLSTASHGRVRERLGQVVHLDMYPLKIDGFRYTDASYLACLVGGGWHSPDGIDYKAVIRDHDLARRVDFGQIDEVTLQGGPYFGYYESRMAGWGASWCNSPPLPRVACSKIFVLMGYNYERADGILHPMGHRSESILTTVYGSWDITQGRHDWERFTHNIGQSPDAACGTAHYPPNGRADYDYANPTPVVSTAIDWLMNFPNLTGATETVSRESWGGPEYQNNYFRWWFSHMPHVDGTNDHDGLVRQNNWWSYLFDFNSFEESGGSHLPGGPLPPATPFQGSVGQVTHNARDDWFPRAHDAGVIVWQGHDGSDYEIYALVPPGTTIIQITDNAFDNESPQVNARGTIVWQEFDGHDYEIFSWSADDPIVRQLTNNDTDDRHPQINDSGIVVWDGFDGSDYEVVSAYADGSSPVQVTDNHAAGGMPRDDVWPLITNAGRVVWCGYDGSDWEIFSANADGSDLHNVSSNGYEDEYPAVNESGRIAWHAWVSDTNADIFSADATGGPVTRLTSGSTPDWHPRINAAGRVVWMSLDPSGDWEILSCDADGANPACLTCNASHDQYPVIDDAGRVYWQGFDGVDWEIYAWDGTVLRVTDNSFHDRAPWASPSGLLVWHGDGGRGTPSTSEIYASPAAQGGLWSGRPLPQHLRIERVVPTPAHTRVDIVLSLAAPGHLSVRILDAAGRSVNTLASRFLPSGSHRFVWNGLTLCGAVAPAGTYLVRAHAGAHTATAPLVWLP